MIICNSKKFIYVHIPKCGGTTISHVLEKRLLPQDVSLAVNPHKGWGEFVETFQKKFHLNKHSTASEIAKAMLPEHFKTYFIFTFSRNPFARAYSAYTFTKRADAKHRPNSERYQAIKDMDFETFLNSKYMQEKLILPARPQVEWIQNSPEEVHLFKLENTESELNSFVKRIYGEELAGEEVGVRNFSAPQGEWKNMSSVAANTIRILYKDDFDFLKYSTKI